MLLHSWTQRLRKLLINETSHRARASRSRQTIETLEVRLLPATTSVPEVQTTLPDEAPQMEMITTNSPPALSGIGTAITPYMIGTNPIFVAPGAVITDPDSINLASATIRITGGYQSSSDVLMAVTSGTGITQSFDSNSGVLTLRGTASLSNYQMALRSVNYSTASSNGIAGLRTLKIELNDGLVNSNIETRLINVTPFMFTPLIASIETQPLAYKGNSPASPISNSVTITSPIQNNLTSLSVQITSGYQNDANGRDVLSFTNKYGITGSFDAPTGILTLSGTAYVGYYREALRTVTFSSTGTNISSANRIITIIASDDGSPATGVSQPVTRTVLFNFPPVVTNIEQSRLVYVANTSPLVITNTAGVTDPDSNNLSRMTIQITSGYQNDANGQDVLSFTNAFGISGSFDASTGTLTLSGSAYAGFYRQALRSVTYSSTGNSVSTANRVLTIIGYDDASTPGVSKPVTRTISSNNAPPIVGSIELTPLVYTPNGLPLAITRTATVTDPDSNNLSILTVQITSGYQNDADGQDVLSFTNTSGIMGSFDASTGKLTLSGIAYLGDYREALRSVSFSSSGTNIRTGNRILTIIATDDGAPIPSNSVSVTRTISVSS